MSNLYLKHRYVTTGEWKAGISRYPHFFGGLLRNRRVSWCKALAIHTGPSQVRLGPDRIRERENLVKHSP